MDTGWATSTCSHSEGFKECPKYAKSPELCQADLFTDSVYGDGEPEGPALHTEPGPSRCFWGSNVYVTVINQILA